jgi:hypothetical protein
VNTYRVMPLESGRWAVEWLVDGVVQGLTYGTFSSRSEAAFYAYELSKMEVREPPRHPGTI